MVVIVVVVLVVSKDQKVNNFASPSNGGVFGSLFGTPIINPPQVC